MPTLALGIQAGNAAAQASLYKNAVDGVKQSTRDATAAMGGLQGGMHSIGQAVRRTVLQLAAFAGVSLTVKHAADEIIGFDSAVANMERTTRLHGRRWTR